jgi:hypothetical protein
VEIGWRPAFLDLVWRDFCSQCLVLSHSVSSSFALFPHSILGHVDYNTWRLLRFSVSLYSSLLSSPIFHPNVFLNLKRGACSWCNANVSYRKSFSLVRSWTGWHCGSAWHFCLGGTRFESWQCHRLILQKRRHKIHTYAWKSIQYTHIIINTFCNVTGPLLHTWYKILEARIW